MLRAAPRGGSRAVRVRDVLGVWCVRPAGSCWSVAFGHLPAAQLDAWYGRYLSAALPAMARWLSPSGDAYEYLAESIRDWPSQAELARRMGAAGWSAIRWRNLTLGVVTVHAALRPG